MVLDQELSDQELPDEEATNVEWHVGHCAECRKAVSAYEEVSGAFLVCYEAAMSPRPRRRMKRVDSGRRGCRRGDPGVDPAGPTSSGTAFHAPSVRRRTRRPWRSKNLSAASAGRCRSPATRGRAPIHPPRIAQVDRRRARGGGGIAGRRAVSARRCSAGLQFYRGSSF